MRAEKCQYIRVQVGYPVMVKSSHGLMVGQARANQSFCLEPPVDWQVIRYFPEERGNVLTLHETVAQTERDAFCGGLSAADDYRELQ